MKTRYMTVLLAALVLFGLVGQASAGKVQLDAGTTIKVKFDPGVQISSSKSVVGVPVQMKLAEPISIGGQVIVEAGAEGTATVAKIEPSGRAGKPGLIVLNFVDLGSKGAFKVANNGRIKLSGTAEGKGKGKKTLSYLFIFGLFIKGGAGQMQADQVYTATIAENVILEN
jgi:hypothetical protein